MSERIMNVSSLVVKVEPSCLADALVLLRNSELCEVHFHDDSGKIVVTVEGESIGDEMQKMKAIQGLPHVLAADLAYSYCEDELEQAREGLSQTMTDSGAGHQRVR
ncbi:MAG: hypothetical protein OHK006_11990 [Thermodesulfovibrionales bacterium]